MLSSAFIQMTSSNLKSPATTLTNGIAMFIPSVQESLLDRPVIIFPITADETQIESNEFSADKLGELKKFSQMDYLEIVTTH